MSELVVLIRKGEEIFAQIDIDSHDVDAFGGDLEKEVEKVASWLSEVYASQKESSPTVA
jgi:putative methionine-R-sulfoxide reductase with GAF domain